MNNIKYKRWQHELIKKALQYRRVLILSGSRQCGKTTLVKELSSKDTIYRTLDNVTLLEAALSDPQSFVEHENQLMIIDKVQRAPVLLQSIKEDVDINQTTGRFLLTGSANIQSLPGVTESLAGRIRKVRLRPLTIGEMLGNQPSFLKDAFTKNLKANKTNLNKKDYLTKAFEGGYPEALRLSGKEVQRWHKDYLDALMERDLKDIIQIKRQDVMHKMLEVIAAWSSKFIDLSAIASSLSSSRVTVKSYINALEALYLVERVRPWSKTDYDRPTKQDKLFMSDSGLMASILRWRMDDVCLDGQKNGKLIETFVFTQLAALIDAQDEDYQLFHYRDREKREIDFLIENEMGDILGIEVKAGSVISKESFKHLLWFKNKLIKSQDFVGMVLYTGQELLSFGDNMWAVPICLLWD